MAIKTTRDGDSTSTWWKNVGDRDLPARQLYVLGGIGQALVDINTTLQSLNETLQAFAPERPRRRRFWGRKAEDARQARIGGAR